MQKIDQPTTYNLQPTTSQEGVTLVIAVVLLATVTFMSFSISSLVIREISGARLILQTEPAISGASAGAEIGLFRLLREAGGTSSSGTTPQSGASYTVVADLYDSPYPFSVAGGELLQISLHDAENPENQAADYGSVTVRNNAGSNTIRVNVYSYSDLENSICQSVIPRGQQYTCSALNYPDDRYLVTLEPTSSSRSATGDVTTTNNAGQPKGVPADFPSIDVTGRSGNVERRLFIEF